MLFERTSITPQGRLDTIEHLFEQVARRDTVPPEPGHLPVEVLEAYGAFETPVRHVLEAAFSRPRPRAALLPLRRIERALNALPESLMGALRTGPQDNWLDFYRRLINLHRLIGDAHPDVSPDEYAAMLQRMVTLADTVSRHSPVRMEAGAVFALLLMQVELERQHPKRKKTRKRKKPSPKKG